MFWGEMSYRYQLGLTGLLYHLKLVFPCYTKGQFSSAEGSQRLTTELKPVLSSSLRHVRPLPGPPGASHPRSTATHIQLGSCLHAPAWGQSALCWVICFHVRSSYQLHTIIIPLFPNISDDGCSMVRVTWVGSADVGFGP